MSTRDGKEERIQGQRPWRHEEVGELLSCGQEYHLYPGMLPSLVCSGRAAADMAGTHCYFHPSHLRLKAHPLLALSEGRRREGGIRNNLCYWRGKRESANLPGQHPGGRKP